MGLKGCCRGRSGDRSFAQGGSTNSAAAEARLPGRRLHQAGVPETGSRLPSGARILGCGGLVWSRRVDPGPLFLRPSAPGAGAFSASWRRLVHGLLLLWAQTTGAPHVQARQADSSTRVDQAPVARRIDESPIWAGHLDQSATAEFVLESAL